MGVGALRSTLLALRSAPTRPILKNFAPLRAPEHFARAPLRATLKSFAPLRSTLRSGAEHFTALLGIGSYNYSFFSMNLLLQAHC